MDLSSFGAQETPTSPPPPPPSFEDFISQLDSLHRHEFEKRCDQVTASRGETIVNQNDVPQEVFIIDRGVVEVVSVSPDGRQSLSLAYLCKGDIFGELGILAQQRRVASIRACEDVTLWRIDRDNFLSLLKRVPQFGYYLSMHLAGRLYRTTSDAIYRSYCTDFGGSLLNFDMLLVFQTIASSGEVGELRLTNENSDLIGSFWFVGNRIENGRFAHLQGIEAVWQIFLEERIEGTFAFQSHTEPSVPYDEAYQIDMDGMGMLMEAASKRDHFQDLPEELRKLQGTLGYATESLVWDDPELEEYTELAAEVWVLIAKRPQLIDSLWRRLNACAYHLLIVVQHLVKTGQATLT